MFQLSLIRHSRVNFPKTIPFPYAAVQLFEVYVTKVHLIRRSSKFMEIELHFRSSAVPENQRGLSAECIYCLLNGSI